MDYRPLRAEPPSGVEQKAEGPRFLPERANPGLHRHFVTMAERGQEISFSPDYGRADSFRGEKFRKGTLKGVVEPTLIGEMEVVKEARIVDNARVIDIRERNPEPSLVMSHILLLLAAKELSTAHHRRQADNWLVDCWLRFVGSCSILLSGSD